MNRSKLYAFVVAIAIAVCAAVAAPASATHNAAKPIHPGVMTFTQGAQCTSNFIFRDGGGTYIGQAAHCSGTGGATETNGCDSGSLPIGTQVEVDGATQPGTLAYNSWLAMQAAGETDADACQYNDFALVRIDPADVGRVDSSVPGFGGPTGLGPVVGDARRHRVLVRQLLASRRDHQAEPEAGRRRPGRGQRLEPDGLHGDARGPRRLRQRIPERLRSGDRHPEHAADPAGGGLQRGRRPAQRARLRTRPRLRRARPGPGTQPFTPDWVGAILNS